MRKCYTKENPDVILLNSTGQPNQLWIPNYKIYKKNYFRENHAGVAIAVRKNLREKCQIINDFEDDILGIHLNDIIIFTYYSPVRCIQICLEELKEYLNIDNTPVILLEI